MTRLLKIRPDWFLLGMVGAVALAWLFPEPGARGGALHAEVLNKVAVALIFFLHGLALSTTALRAGALRWRLHLVVQVCTFVVFPVLGLMGLAVAGDRLSPDLRLGVFFLCALPSTVSSSVAMTAAAGGNVAAAVFNATLSSLIGVFLTPLWLGWMMETTGGSLPLGRVVIDLVVWLVLPLFAGQLARPILGGWASRNRRRIHLVDRLTILLLVYTSFADSMKEGVWSGRGASALLGSLIGSAVLFFAVLGAVGVVCDALKFPREDRIAAVFCGSKKTLASGVPMAQILFGNHPGLGLILLPIMVYHPLQLIASGILAGRWARQAASARAEGEST